MVITFIAGFASVFGTAEGIRHTQAKSRREEHRSRKNNLIVRCVKSSQFSPQLEGRRVVLSGDKLYVDTGTEYDQAFGHPFAGYYLPFPDSKYSGLVSTICDEPPIMNWIYIDRDTYEVKFGNRAWAEHNLTGPFDCTRQDRRLTFAGWEGFCVVQEGEFWAVYFDRDMDELRSKVARGTPVIEVELVRREMRLKPLPRASGKEEGEEEGGDSASAAAAAAPAPTTTAAPAADTLVYGDMAPDRNASAEDGATATTNSDAVSVEGSEGTDRSDPATSEGTLGGQSSSSGTSSEQGESSQEKEQSLPNRMERSGYRSPSVEDAEDRGENGGYKSPSVENMESPEVD